VSRAALLLLTLVGCVKTGSFECDNSAQCTLNGVGGTCTVEGYCAFPDPNCASGMRFGDRSGPTAGQCTSVSPIQDGSMTDTPPGSSAKVVIAELYASGGKSGAAYDHDYAVLRNVDTAPASLSGWSFQHYKTGVGWQTLALPAVSIPAASTFLVALYNDGGTGAGAALPTPGITSPADSAWNLSTSNGESIAITTSTAVLTSCTSATIVDLVGFNTGAPCSEGGSLAPTTTATQAAQRKAGGTQDTNSNGADFVLATPAP
jgi:hypothetical protein